AWCKANPDKASFGGPLGSSQHFSGVMFARGAGIDLRLIGYKGGAPAVVDTLGGHIPMVVTPLSEALPHVREGRLRMLATTGRRRSKAVPDVPTLYELGYKDVIFQDWSGFLAPAGMPADLVARANSAVQEVLKEDKVVQALANLGS